MFPRVLGYNRGSDITKVRVYIIGEQFAVGKQHGHIKTTPSSTRPQALVWRLSGDNAKVLDNVGP